ncbi:recombinase family protein [Sphingosinicella humi]|uniref:Resolvase n=1 Tax=Allosphingosinicella humi TaxID=2068657 RepID=A0A2U2J509_9SPHN|nr:resolvase [Sphingosinicella humi]
MTAYVPYVRVSTAKQGRSGLGLEAQEEAIRQFLKPGDSLLSPTYVEVESGRRGDRPELAKALAHAKLTRATLLVAKLDRLSRDTKFLLTLIDSGVDVAFGDLPQVEGAMGRFILTQMAAVAELEAGLTSQRTKAALAAAKARGVKLGGFRGVKVDPAQGREAKRKAAEEFRQRIAPVFQTLKAEGIVSASALARSLNEKGIRTRRGGNWTATQVLRVL